MNARYHIPTLITSGGGGGKTVSDYVDNAVQVFHTGVQVPQSPGITETAVLDEFYPAPVLWLVWDSFAGVLRIDPGFYIATFDANPHISGSGWYESSLVDEIGALQGSKTTVVSNYPDRYIYEPVTVFGGAIGQNTLSLQLVQEFTGANTCTEWQPSISIVKLA